MRRIAVLMLMLAGFATLHPVDAQVQTYKFSQTYSNNGVESKCSFYVPSSYNPENSYPMFYAWHGTGMTSSEMNEFMLTTIARALDAIVVAPDANNVVNQVQLDYLIDTTLSFIFSTYNIDPQRTIVTGYSSGGRIAYEIGLRRPDLFAGIIGIAPAVIESDFDQAMWQNIDKKRMATIIGDRDMNYSLVNTLMNQIIIKGGGLRYLVKQNINHWDTYFEQDLFRNDYRDCYDYIVNSTTPVGTVAEANTFAVSHYPSPAQTTVSFTLPATHSHSYDINIHDVSGRICYQGKTMATGSDQNWSLNCSQFPSGIYFAEIHTDGKVAIESFVVSQR